MSDKYIFILRTTRCRKKLLRSLLDGHPDLLVWPTEIAMFSYYKHLLKNNGFINIDAWSSLISDRLNSVKIDMQKVFDQNLFLKKLREKNKFLSVNEFLKHNFDCFLLASKNYKNKKNLKKIKKI